MLVTILVFILILGLLVFVHELGHFLAAKRVGVWVKEFAFGFRPRLWGRKIGETTYAVNAVPLGGYIHMHGEDSDVTDKRSYGSKSIAARFFILIAGPTMNIILAWLFLAILFVVGFEPIFPGSAQNPFVSSLQTTSVVEVADGSPALQAGLLPGDKIVSVEGQTIASDMEFILKISERREQATTITVERNGEQLDVSAVPRTDPPAGEGALGVTVRSEGEVRSDPHLAPLAAGYETGRITALSVQGVANFLKNLVVRQEVSEEVTGLIGIGAMTGVARRMGFDYLMQLIAIVSIGLGVVNLLPILPLDGGHIAALGYEKVRGKKLKDRHFSILTALGLSFVIVIFLVVTFQDVIRFDIWGRLF